MILRFGKNVENRQKNSHYRGTIAIHASQTKSKERFEDCPIKFDPKKLDFGAVLGFVNLEDVILKKGVTQKNKKVVSGKIWLRNFKRHFIKKPG